MRWSEITAPPTDRRLREFAATGAMLCACLAAWNVFVRAAIPIGGVLGAIATAISLIGIFRPRWLAPIFTAAMIVTFPFAWIVSVLVLAGTFYGLITPLALVFRLLGRDALFLRRSGQLTYWQDKPAARSPRRYLRQY